MARRDIEFLDELVGKCDLFKVISTIEGGAFVNCGLKEDLFVPRKNQLTPMQKGEWHLVYVYRFEKSGRLTGSSQLNKFIYEEAPADLAEGDEVDLFIFSETDMAYKAVVNGDSWGVLYKNEVFRELHLGQKLKGYVKKIRPDRKIDLLLEKTGYQGVPDLSQRIKDYLKASGGSAPLTDKTPPEEIYRLFGISKKKFKMAIGDLYKKRIVDIKQGSIQWIEGK